MSIYGTGEWEQKNRLLKFEINQNKVNIDRACFKKTKEERLKLTNAKISFKNK